MTILNLIILLTALGHPGSNDALCNQDQIQVTDSLRLIEKVYIHTDRNCYYTGDDIWFKAYLLDASERSLSGNSNNLHVELISPLSKVLISRVVRIEEGLGNGDFKLPGTLQSGQYLLRAYTNYMRNFSDQLFFRKEIYIINSADTISQVADEIKHVYNRIDLSFFPEGGSLVDNVSSKVAFKAVDAAGKGCDITGEIFSSEGELITAFKSSHHGMGSFFIRPVPGLGYYSLIKTASGDAIRFDLPGSFLLGVTLSTAFNQNNELVITARTNPETFQQVSSHDLFLTFSARNNTLKRVSFRIKSYNNSFTLPVDDLPDGIIMMTLSATDDLPLSERLVFIQRKNDLKVTIESDKPVYKQRDSVEIKLSFDNATSVPQESYLSLTAVEKRFEYYISQYPSTISSWFLLESDIRGPIEEPSYYFDQSNPDRIHDLDLLLLTQGWRDFKWKYDEVNYYRPEKGFTISGRVRKYSIDKPLEVKEVNIGLLENKSSLITTAPVDSAGRFRLEGIDFTGDARLIVSSVNKKGQPQGLVIIDTLKYLPSEVTHKFFRSTLFQEESAISFKQEYEIKETIRKKYKLSDTISLGEVSVIARKTENFQTKKVENARVIYGKPDNEIIVTPRFAGYSNVFEVLRGRVAGVQVNETNGGYVIRIRGINSISLTGMPLFLIDGVKKTYDDLKFLPVGFVDRIDVLKSAGETAMFGVQGANGVISVITKTGDSVFDDQSVSHSANIKISGYDAARVFYSPQHFPSEISAKEPDFRTTLLWKPNIRLQSDRSLHIKYFNADNSSVIKVIAEGITSTGIPITASTEYEIR